VSEPLPKLLDARMLAAELGVTVAVAETVMQKVPKHRIGRRVFADRADIAAYLQSTKVTAQGHAA
jgi:hypothetical protein